MHEPPIRALVVGTGFGCRVHAPALRAAGFDVVGLVGRMPDKLQRKAEQLWGALFFLGVEEANPPTDPQLGTVATTPSTHAQLAAQAIARGRHVLCEKPFAFDAQQGKALLRAAETAGVTHMVP